MSPEPERARVTFVYGTRPEAIKLAPLIRAVGDHPALAPRVVVTGQHREMLDQVHEVFGISPDIDLDLMRPAQTLADITCGVLDGVSRELRAHPAAAVVVQGDTTTTLAGALAAFYERMPVVHVEAGLRSGDTSSPFPEEANRTMVTRLAELNLTPTQGNREALLREGVDVGRVVVTGNTVIDALQQTLLVPRPYSDPAVAAAIDGAQRDGRRLVAVTSHRREAWGAPMRAIGRGLRELALMFPDVVWVLPVHRNPRVREDLLPPVAGVPNVIVTEPMPYPEFCQLLSDSTLALTDSGGVQEEAPSLGLPVLVMRETTERPEAVECGAVALVGHDTDVIVRETARLLTDTVAYAEMAKAVNPYGDGAAAPRSVAAIAAMLGRGERLPDFTPHASA